MRQVLTTDDLDRDLIDRVIARASTPGPRHPLPAPFVLATLFTTSSLRTRVGFTAAAHRLGGHVIHIDALRFSESMSSAEPLGQAIASLATMVDALVIRSASRNLSSEVGGVRIPILNGGDASGNHPTQALGDLAVLRRQGDVPTLRVGMVGDFSMRAAQSLLQVLHREPPALLRCFTLPDLMVPTWDASTLQVRSTLDDVSDLDVLYVIGLPAHCQDREISEEMRRTLQVKAQVLDRLSPSALVYSPGPIIDELDASAISRVTPGLLDAWRLVQDVRVELLREVLSASTGEA